MTVEMTNDEMYVNIVIMSRAAEKGKLGYAIARNLRRMKDAAKEYLDLRDELIRNYGEKNAHGLYVVPREKENEFTADLGDIPQIKHEVEIFKVDEDTFINGTLTSNQMEQLLWMIEEE